MENSVEIIDWKSLLAYTKLLSNGDETKVKICLIDEENEEIRLDNEDEFLTNVQFAHHRNESNLIFKIYINEKFVFRGIYSIKTPLKFPRDKLEQLIENISSENWFIPVKQDESLAICLNAAIQLASEGQLESNPDGQKFVETVLPEVFRKLQTTSMVDRWPREIHCGIFEMLEYLVDLVAVRIRRSPVPMTLLDVLGMSFDTNTNFSQKHQNEYLPTQRSYQLIENNFLRGEQFGWLRSLLQRLIAQDALNYLRLQFEYVDSTNSTKAAMEYNVLLKLFSRCHVCINPQRFRLIFARPIQQTLQYLKHQNKTNEIIALNETLIELCRNYYLEKEYEQLIKLPFNIDLAETNVPSGLLIDFDSPTEVKTTNDKSSRSMMMENFDDQDWQTKNVKKQRTEEQVKPLFTREQLINSIRELTLAKEKHQASKKTEEQRSDRKSIPMTLPSNQSDPDEILRLYNPMKQKVEQLYDELQLAMSNGQLRDVIKIEEKLKLLNPYSARFVSDATIPDGTILSTGERFQKCWILLNDGSLPWDKETIRLINLINGIRYVEQPIVPITAPHTRTEIMIDFIAPDKAGTYESKWILAYRDQTFGPMFWCQIEVRSKEDKTLHQTFDLVDIPLPSCFDMSKPFSAIRSNEDLVEKLSDDFDRINVDSRQTVSLPPPPPPPPMSQTRSEILETSRPINTVMNSFVTVAKQAGSTAKAIFNTLQANDTQSRPLPPPPPSPSRSSNSDFSVSPFEPMTRLVEMGFGNRAKNQRLLRENGNDLAKVIELLTSDVIEDPNWFNHRH